jgi:hypothetical protein
MRAHTRHGGLSQISAARPAGRRVPPEGAGAAGRSNLWVVRSASLVPRIRHPWVCFEKSEIYDANHNKIILAREGA